MTNTNNLTFKAYQHVEERLVDTATARELSSEKDDSDIFWVSGAYCVEISETREKVYYRQTFIGVVWQNKDSGFWDVYDSEGSWSYEGFATKEYACNFLVKRASILKLNPDNVLID